VEQCLIYLCAVCIDTLQLAIKAGGVVRTLDESDELAFLRIRSKKHEIMIAPDKDYILVVVQIPHDV
jgi:dynein light chain roadblock-type